ADAQDGAQDEGALRPDARPEIRHLDGQLRQLRRPLPARLLGLRRGGQGDPGRRLRARLSAAAGGADRRARQAPGEDPAGALAGAEAGRGGKRLSGMAAFDPAAVHAALRSHFGDAVGDLAGTRPDNAGTTVAPRAIVEVCRFLKTETGLAFDCLSHLSGVAFLRCTVLELVYDLDSY